MTIGSTMEQGTGKILLVEPPQSIDTSIQQVGTPIQSIDTSIQPADILIQPTNQQPKRYEYLRHMGFAADTLERYLGILVENMPEVMKYLRKECVPSDQKSPETAYISCDKSQKSLTLDGMKVIGIAKRLAEKKGNLVAELNPETAQFEPATYLPTSLYKNPKDPNSLDYIIIGVVGPSANNHAKELYNAISEALHPHLH